MSPVTELQRRELLREMLARRAKQASEDQPTSVGQRALWMFDQLHPGSPAYHLSGAARVEGPFDVDTMRAAFQQVIDRHPVLRTGLVLVDDELKQRVATTMPADFTVVDLTGQSPAEVDKAVTAFTERPFNLATGPMMRAQVAKLDDERHLLLLSSHHIATDLWSFGILAEDLRRGYLGEQQDRPGVSYLEFVRWQQENLAGPRATASAEYWQRQLDGDVPRLDLPLDHPRPARPAHRAAGHSFTLDRQLTAGLKRIARDAGATPYVALLTVFTALMHRYTGQRDIWIGSATSSRGQAAFQEVLGYFANMMVVRTKLDHGVDFTGLLGQVRDTVLDGMEHQDFPYPMVVRQVADRRDDGSTTLFDVAFHYETAPWQAQRGLSLLGTGFEDAEIELGPVTLRPYEVPTHGSEHDLTLFVEEIDGVSYCSLRYAVDLFERETVVRMAEHLQTLAGSCVAQPTTDIGMLPMLSAAERKQLLEEWNRPDDGIATAGSCAHHVVMAQAERTPDNLAVVCEERSLTYRSLVAEAGRLAAFLRSRGVGPEVKVGLFADGSCDLMVGMLGVMMSGGAYVPLDPGYPAKRVSYMLADSAVALLLTQRHLVPSVSEVDVPVICLDEPIPDVGTVSGDEPTASNLAYIIYTSGSTGRPKGVLVEHRGVVDLDLAHRDGFAPDPSRRILLNSSISFDVSTWEWMMALGTGATLHLAPRKSIRPGPPLIDVVHRRGITALSATPSVLATMNPADLPTVTELTSVGEAISADIVTTWAPGRRIVNAYGPTEITVFCTVEECVPDGRTPAIGRPVAGTELYVLDSYLQPVPVGVVGELYIGGTGVTRGYQNRPDLTADRYMPHPFSSTPGARVYRTGDRVRYSRDGRLHYLGRNDHQVKIRGVRTEPGEVQAAVTEHPGVREAVVLARPAPSGELRLVAYVVPTPGCPVTPAEVKDYLAERLMPNMVPSFVIVLDAFPLNPNGKVDRAQLPEPEAVAPTTVDLATPTERQLAEIWCAVLGLSAVGAEDNFFDAGGHSLLATKLVARIAERFGVTVALHEVFDAPTVRTLATRIDTRVANGRSVAREDIPRLPRTEGLPLSFAQQRLWFMEQLRPGDQAYRLAGELHLTGPVDVAALQEAMAEVVRRHESLRTVYVVRDNEPRQLVTDGVADPLPLVDGDLATIRAKFDAEPFDLTRSPAKARLIRVTSAVPVHDSSYGTNGTPGEVPRTHTQSVRKGHSHGPTTDEGPTTPGQRSFEPERYVALLALHHIAADGWSMRILVRELLALYRGETLPPVDVQYADFASWQRDRVDEQGLNHWVERLQGSPQALDLPTDFPRSNTRRAGRAGVELNADLTRALARGAENATMAMTLMAAFDVVLSRWARQSDVLVGLPVAGRSRTDIEGTVGLFVNTLVIRTDTSGSPEFRELVGRVREAVLAADAHQDVPFERIVERLAPDRDVTRTPVFQVVFNMINLDPLAVEVPGVDVRLVETEDVSPRFDLTLYAKPHGDEITLDLVYDAALFEKKTADAMLAQLTALLDQVAANPAVRIDEITLAAAQAAKPAEIPSGRVEDRFLRVVRERPYARALVSSSGELSYTELASRSSAYEVPAGRVKAIKGERTAELVIEILGTLRAGGTFAILDQKHPRTRLDACAELLTTQVPEGTAYVAFTSGSTGGPKAVVGPHAPLAHFVNWYTGTFDIDHTDRFALTSGLGHDPLLRDIFVPLSVGASLYVPGDEVLADPEAMVDWLAAHEITVLHLTPPTARFLAGARKKVPSLRYVFFGGDQLTGHEVNLVRDLGGPELTVVNFYGATETPQAPAHHVVGDVQPGQVVPVGTGIDGMAVHVVRDGRPAAVGELGEIVVSGEFLATGYLGGEPFGGEYRTGDLGRQRADGTVVFAGRADRQVKVRGTRIDPAEIENCLRAHPDVVDAVIVSTTDGAGESILTAYVTGPVDRDVLRGHVAARLPAAMVPARFAVLAEFPLTPNGKVDLAKLPAATPPAVTVVPESVLEAQVAEIWARLLGVDRVGRTDNFFDLGGHSLLMVRLQAVLRDELDRDVPVVELFRCPTVAALAEALERPATAKAVATTDHADKRAERRRRLRQGRQA